VSLDEDHNWQVEVFLTIGDLWNACYRAHLILIDMPIGLPGGGVMSRRCDAESRKLLGKRHCTVFSPPCREALQAADYEQAKGINHRHLGRKVTKQCFGIFNKIEQVETFMRTNPNAARTFREVHPEVCFWALNGEQAIGTKKSTEPGMEERLHVLSTLFPLARRLFGETVRWQKESRVELARDDIIDALAAAVTGLQPDRLESLPKEREVDAVGMPMEMVYRRL
jgi:predicted RNase H-like nuclease